jgi:hypothetical protein
MCSSSVWLGSVEYYYLSGRNKRWCPLYSSSHLKCFLTKLIYPVKSMANTALIESWSRESRSSLTCYMFLITIYSMLGNKTITCTSVLTCVYYICMLDVYIDYLCNLKRSSWLALPTKDMLHFMQTATVPTLHCVSQQLCVYNNQLLVVSISLSLRLYKSCNIY